MFSGSITALITPFKNGALDEVAYEQLIERQVQAGSHGVVSSGTTGESPTLTHEEHNRVTDIAVKTAAGRMKVIAGTGSNATHEAISMTQHAEKAGADGALVVVPYYNKPTQEGLFQHFKAVHDESGIPILLYDVPGRSVVGLSLETIERLAELPRIVGIKDATGDLSRPKAIAPKVKADFVQVSGEDDTIVDYLKEGGDGIISVTSNIAPELCAKMHEAFKAGDVEAAEHIQEQLTPLHEVMFCETSPSPAKYAAYLMGLCSDELRLPMVLPSAENQQRIEHVLRQLELI